jgi:hypothetical protein
LTIVDNLDSMRIRLFRRLMRRGAAVLLLILLAAAACAAAEPRYRVSAHIPISDARWDYGAVDPEAHRLYLGRIGGVLALDLSSGTVTPVLVPSALVHGVAPLGGGLVMSTNGEANSVSLFEGISGRELATIPVGKQPDAIVREPHTGLVITTNQGSHDLSVIDPIARRLVATIRLPGTPEYAAAGADGLLFDNITDRNEVAVVDVAARRVLRSYPLRRCQGPTGLAYDAPDDLLLAVCRNGVAVFLRGRAGFEVANLDVGSGPDAAMFDVPRHLAFVPAGGPGSLTVLAVHGAVVTKVQTLKTRPGSRTAILDPATGLVYVPAAQFRAATDPHERPSAVPGTSEILVIEPER